MSREAMQLALDALEPIVNNSALDPQDQAYAAQQILRAALAELVPEPDLIKEFENWHTLYEELRAAIDGGSESMTHADALAQVKACKCCDVSAAQPAPSVPDDAHAQGYAAGRVQSHAVDGCPEVPLPTSERGETLQYRYGEMLKHGQSCYAAGRASLVPLLEQARQTLGVVANLGPNDQFQIQAEENAIIAIEAALKEIKP